MKTVPKSYWAVVGTSWLLCSCDHERDSKPPRSCWHVVQEEGRPKRSDSRTAPLEVDDGPHILMRVPPSCGLPDHLKGLPLSRVHPEARRSRTVGAPHGEYPWSEEGRMNQNDTASLTQQVRVQPTTPAPVEPKPEPKEQPTKRFEPPSLGQCLDEVTQGSVATLQPAEGGKKHHRKISFGWSPQRTRPTRPRRQSRRLDYAVV